MSELLRAGDADREATAALLRRAHEEGRLDTSELEERIERCYGSKTTTELHSLVADLPHPRRGEPPSRPRLQPFFLIPLALVALIVATATSAHGVFIFPLLFFVVMRFVWRRPRWR